MPTSSQTRWPPSPNGSGAAEAAPLACDRYLSPQRPEQWMTLIGRSIANATHMGGICESSAHPSRSSRWSVVHEQIAGATREKQMCTGSSSPRRIKSVVEGTKEDESPQLAPSG